MAAFSYEYKVNGLQKVPAQVVGELCEQLQNSAAGLSPRTLLDASRQPSDPLHGEFEWDDTKAAENYRLHQAAGIIRNIVIVTAEENGDVKQDRGFVSIPGGTSNYVTLDSAFHNDEWKAHLLEQARLDMITFLGKYRRLQELAGVNAAMQAALEKQEQAVTARKGSSRHVAASMGIAGSGSIG